MVRPFLLGLVIVATACGGETPAPTVPPVTTVASTGGAVTAYRDIRIIDGRGRAPTEHGTVVIEGTRIRAVGKNIEMVDAGLTPIQAIHLATASAAALLGEDDRGVLAPGKLADLLVVNGNPAGAIEATDNVVAVWHRGVKLDPMP